MPKSKFLLATLSILLLGACKFSSQYDLHRPSVAFSPPAFFEGRSGVFTSRKGSYILMDFKDGLATLTLTELDVDKTDYTRTTSLIIQPQKETGNLYFFVYPESGKYSYFPFHYTDSGFIWIKPKKTITVNSIDAMLTQARDSEHQRIEYFQVDAAEAANLRREYKFVQAAKEKKRKDKKKKKN